MVISIHAPPRGATSNINIPEILLLFQFTPLREGRQFRGLDLDATTISIHAPPRGATFACSDFVACHLFQFTPLREGRRAYHYCI